MSNKIQHPKSAEPSDGSNHTEARTAKKPDVRFWPYAVLGSFLLVVFVIGILASDYFNYRIRLARIEAAKQAALITAPTAAPSSGKNASGATSAPAPAPDPLEVKSSEIFETYGKLLTMLLGFISVLGVFFGYFVRKSLREVEEDLRDHVALNMDLWAKEKDRLTGEVTGKLTEITEQQREHAKLVADFEKTLDRSKQALQALEAAAKSEEQPLLDAGARTAKAAAAIDADTRIPKPAGK